MKKKIEKLRRAGRLEGNTAFEALWDTYQATGAAYEQIKTDRKIARATLHFERDQAGADASQADKLFELDMAVMRAEGERLISRAEYQLAKFRLRRWIDAFTHLPVATEKKTEKKAGKAKPQSAKKAATPAKSRTPRAATQPAAPARRKKTSKTGQV